MLLAYIPNVGGVLNAPTTYLIGGSGCLRRAARSLVVPPHDTRFKGRNEHQGEFRTPISFFFILYVTFRRGSHAPVRAVKLDEKK